MRNDLTLTAGSTVAATAVLVITDLAPMNEVVRTAIQIPAGLPLVLLLPGYAVSTLLLPLLRNRPANSSPLLWHGMWSVCLSLVIAVAGGLLLNLTPAGLTHLTWTLWLAGVTLLAVAASAAMNRRGPGTSGDHSTNPASAPPGSPAQPQARPFSLRGRGRRWLRPTGYALAISVVLGASIGLADASAEGQRTQHFAQLWLVPAQTAGSATLGVRNGYPTETAYHLVLRRGGHDARDWNLTLAPGQSWDTTVPAGAGQHLSAELTTPTRRTAPRVVALQPGR